MRANLHSGKPAAEASDNGDEPKTSEHPVPNAKVTRASESGDPDAAVDSETIDVGVMATDPTDLLGGRNYGSRMSSVPASDARASGTRRAELARASATWLERLLALSCSLSSEDGEIAVARSTAMALSEWIELPVGVCLVLAEGAGQEVLRVLPGGDAQGGSVDPARLFPGFTIEHVFTVRVDGADGSGEETTLHIAADSYELEPAFVQLGEQAAMVLGSALSAARKRIEARRTARELNKLQAYIIQADKLASMGQLAAGVVHELNNPLTSIVAYTEYLIRKGTANPNADQDDLERLRRVGESAGRMLRLTRDLVTYARPSSDIAVPVVIEQVIEKAIAFCEHVVAEVGAKVERRFEPELPPVRGMPEELAQVFVNLVTNACHACARGDGVLIVTTSISDHASHSTTRWIQVTVEDNGHGIEEQNLPHIFAPFFTTKGEGRGTGLGLAIVKNILDKHAGDIHAEAGSQGGTRFVLRFPALEG